VSIGIRTGRDSAYTAVVETRQVVPVVRGVVGGHGDQGWRYPAAFCIQFLAHCYKFVAADWQHATRDISLPDQGFERQFREACIGRLPQDWTVSQHREMQLGYGLDTASGVLHEIDIVARNSDLNVIVELKNWQIPSNKNEVIVLFAKLVDYLAANPGLLERELCPAFISTSTFEPHALAACVGLGIHPIALGLRPLPLLIDYARRMQAEMDRGLRIDTSTAQLFDDHCAQINALTVALEETWFSTRFGAVSESRIVVKAVSPLQTVQLGQEMQTLSTNCSALLTQFRRQKARP